MVATETDIDVEKLRELAASAADARLHDIPVDGVVMQAIAMGLGTRRELRDALNLGYDVIEKCLERLSGDISYQMVGQIERFYVPANAPKPKVEYICVDCGKPRSYGSAQRCSDCYKARAEANRRPPRTDLDANDRAHQEIAAKNGNNSEKSLHVELGPEEEEAVVAAMRDDDEPAESVEKVSAKAPRNFETFDPRRGATYKELDLVEVERLMATEETMAEAAKKLGMTTAQLSVRRQKDDAVAAAVDRGRRRYYDGLPEINVDAEDDGPPKSEKIITKTITDNPPCGCGRPGNHIGRCAFRRAKAGGEFPAKKPSKNGQKTAKKAARIEREPTALARSSVSVETPKQAMALKITPQQMIDRFNSFDDGEIDEFFSKMNEKSAVDNVVRGVLPDEPKLDPQLVRVAYNVLVTILDHDMKDSEKLSVWELIRYLKRREKEQYR